MENSVHMVPKSKKVGKRTDYITWNEMFFLSSLLASQRSKDPNTQVGAFIVDSANHILSEGYNGFPNGCSDDDFPWAREGDPLDTKYLYVVHAELNAILNYPGEKEKLKGSTLYVALFPCNECAKAIIQTGIKRVVMLSDKYAGTPGNRAAKRMFDAAGVEYAIYPEEEYAYYVASLSNKYFLRKISKEEIEEDRGIARILGLKKED